MRLSSIKQKYITSAVVLIAANITVKLVSALYKIPLTSYIGALGRGYFSIAYNLCLPIHSLTMGAFPIALTKLVSSCSAKGDVYRIKALKIASKRLFALVGLVGTVIMIVFAVPYSRLISSSPMAVYTILALAPSVFFSCMCGCHRAFAEGYLDMKSSAVSQVVEALFKAIFGLLMAKASMSILITSYEQSGTVFGVQLLDEQSALAFIYPITSACAMLGATVGSIASYIFAAVYNMINYRDYPKECADTRKAYYDLTVFAAPLVIATAVSGVSNFVDNATIQFALSKCNSELLKNIYNCKTDDVYTYVYGVYSAALDFKNLVPSVVMSLGITAVPAVSLAYESSRERYSRLLSSIFKYTVLMSCMGGVMLCLFSKEILTFFYAKSNPDIVSNASVILFWLSVGILPCCVASTSVYCAQSLGFSRQTILPFAISMLLRAVINIVLIPNETYNISAAAVSNFAGFGLIFIWNMVTIKKKTNARFRLCEIFLKPIICSVCVFFASYYVKNNVLKSENFYLGFFANIVVCLLLFALLLVSTRIISVKDIKSLK